MPRCPIRSRRPLALALVLGLALVAGPTLLAVRPASAATTFTVTTVGDNPDADLADDRCDTTLDGATAPCSLRAAIEEADATPGPDTIRFNIPGPGVKTIRPASRLPNIERKVTIDGYTQPGAKPNTAAVGTNAVLLIELDGGDAVGEGLTIVGPNVLVRGLVINRFTDDGIEIFGQATGTQIEGCFIGTDAAGTASRGNAYGVLNAGTATQIGGSGPAARNLISGNESLGVTLSLLASGSRILGNLIGTDRTGGAPLGNGRAGVRTLSANHHVGGASAGQANTIAFNGEAGVEVIGDSAGVRVLRNSIFANGGLGIDLDGDGVTPNDPLDTDDGPNTLQNVPEITGATSGSVTGTLHSTPNQDFVLRLFSNPGSGDEGKVFAAEPLIVTTDDAGNATFTFTPNPPIPAGRSVTATATNNGGSTSEFSAAVLVTSS